MGIFSILFRGSESSNKLPAYPQGFPVKDFNTLKTCNPKFANKIQNSFNLYTKLDTAGFKPYLFGSTAITLINGAFYREISDFDFVIHSDKKLALRTWLQDQRLGFDVTSRGTIRPYNFAADILSYHQNSNSWNFVGPDWQDDFFDGNLAQQVKSYAIPGTTMHMNVLPYSTLCYLNQIDTRRGNTRLDRSILEQIKNN